MPSPSAFPDEVEFELSDLSKLSCTLCTRQFKTLDQLRKHNKGSDLHNFFLFLSYLCRKILTLSSAITRRKPRDAARGNANAARAATEASSASAHQPPHRNISIRLQDEVSCITNQISRFLKASRISTTAGKLITAVRTDLRQPTRAREERPKKSFIHRFNTPSPRPGKRVIYKCARYE